MTEITVKTPWEGSMGGIPMHLDYFDGSMFEAVERIAMKYPATSLLTSWAAPPPIPAW